MARRSLMNFPGIDEETRRRLLAYAGKELYQQYTESGEPSVLGMAIAHCTAAVELGCQTADNHNILCQLHYIRYSISGDSDDIRETYSSAALALERVEDEGETKLRYAYQLRLSAKMVLSMEQKLVMRALDSAIIAGDVIIDLLPEGHEGRLDALLHLSDDYRLRARCYSRPSDIQRVVVLCDEIKMLDETNPEYISDLAEAYVQRYNHTKDSTHLNHAIQLHHEALEINPQDENFLIHGRLGSALLLQYNAGSAEVFDTAIHHLREAIASPDRESSAKYTCILAHLFRRSFELDNTLEDNLNTAIELGETLVPSFQSTPDVRDELVILTAAVQHLNLRVVEDMPLSQEQSLYCHGLAGSLSKRYHMNPRDNQQDIQRAIELWNRSVRGQFSHEFRHPNLYIYLVDLGIHYATIALSDSPFYINALNCFGQAATSPYATSVCALAAARWYSGVAVEHQNYAEAIKGYRTAIHLLARLAPMALDEDSRNNWIQQERPELIGCEAASCAIKLEEYEQAVTLLDMGRSIFWKQAALLRAQVDRLKAAHYQLGEDFTRVTQALDAGNFLVKPSQDGLLLPQDNHMALNRAKLVDDYVQLLVEIRKKEGFGNFLGPQDFESLRANMGNEIVVTIILSGTSSDALIFDKTGDIKHVHLANLKPGEIEKLASAIHNPSGVWDSETALNKHLQYYRMDWFWEDVLEPIFSCLEKFFPSKDKRHVRWYLTGALAQIPIHAMGPFDITKPDVHDRVISSYVTTLSLLSEKPQPQHIVRKFLGVSMTETEGKPRTPRASEEVENARTVLIDSGNWNLDDMSHLANENATKQAILDEMRTCTWLHLACHGEVNTNSGLDSSFVFADGRLSLREIAGAHPKHIGKIAYLDACRTAQVLNSKALGEAMHLAAGFQFIGYQNVVASMWPIMDEVAAEIAQRFYVSLMKEDNVPKALHNAITELKSLNIPSLAWAPFVVYKI